MTENIKKIIILTDSTGSPRRDINNEFVDLDQTFPYLLKKKYKNCKFWQLSFSSISTKRLLAETQAYLPDWKPDIIIVHSGINDCKPSVFSERSLKIIIKKLGRFSKYLKHIIYNPFFIKIFNNTSSTPKNFNRDINIFKSYFQNSKIIWTEISCLTTLNTRFPDVLKNQADFNYILKNNFGDNFVEISEDLKKENGFLKDGLHYNSDGHNIIFEKISKKL